MRTGGTALDAVEVAARAIEADISEMSVGRGGLPNVLGEVELDAGIMDGRTLRVGAVAAVQNYGHPITLARAVMEKTPHVLLAGAWGRAAGRDIGHGCRDLACGGDHGVWRERFDQFGLDPNAVDDLIEAVATLTRPVHLDPTSATPRKLWQPVGRCPNRRAMIPKVLSTTSR